MTCRCPYCKTVFPEEPPSRCPTCGRQMIVPKMKASSERLAHQRKKERILREFEQKKAALSSGLPQGVRHKTGLYLLILFVFFLLGAAIFKMSHQAPERRNPILTTLERVNRLAEALGRYRFHTGVYPTKEQGLIALVRNPLTVDGWNGPYISRLPQDHWNRDYVYNPDALTNGCPVLFSCGPDKTPGTEDDIYPLPSRFDPGTAWTNTWTRQPYRTEKVLEINLRPSRERSR